LRLGWGDRTLGHNKGRRGRRVSEAEVTLSYELTLSVPPVWRDMTKTKRRGRIEALVEASEAMSARERRATGRKVPSARKILSQSPLSRPRKVAPAERARVYCRDEALEEAFLAGARKLRSLYLKVLDVFRKAAARGRRFVGMWPPSTYAPSTLRPVRVA